MERRTPEEEQELQRIKNALEDFYIPEGETFSESKTDKEFSETSNEAQSLMEYKKEKFDQLLEKFSEIQSYNTKILEEYVSQNNRILEILIEQNRGSEL
ncbi:hypothetical protein FHJ99_14220 (plasmid) [Enterococcus faecium]|nr:hypothetical protein FHJ99_14220 [Enterococcus faecium]